MSDEKTKDSTGSEIIYHFKVSQHRIPLTLSIDAAQATKDILDDFNRHFFNGKLKYKLDVAPPEEGGHIKTIIITLLTGTILQTTYSNILDFVESDVGKSFTEELTGQKPAYWSGKAGQKLRNLLIDESNVIHRDERNVIHKSDEKTPSYKIDEDTEKLLVNCMAGMPIYFLSHDIDKLTANNITPDKFRKSFNARNKFYKTCMENKEIQGLSFDRSHNFPIKKENFESLIVKIPDSKYFTHSIVDIVVSSPNWKITGRGWQTSKLITFHIDDTKFWKYVDNKTITPRFQDSMQVQWIYEYNKIRPQKVRVLRVISYNGDPISKPLSGKEIQKICDDKNAFSEDQEHAKSLENKSNLLTDLPDDNKNDSED